MREHLGDFAVLELDQVRVVGREAPERIFALLGDETLAKDPAFLALRECHDPMLTAYRAGDWPGTSMHLEYLKEHAESFGLTQLYALYGERLAALSGKPPPQGWDGVFEARSK